MAASCPVARRAFAHKAVPGAPGWQERAGEERRFNRRYLPPLLVAGDRRPLVRHGIPARDASEQRCWIAAPFKPRLPLKAVVKEGFTRKSLRKAEVPRDCAPKGLFRRSRSTRFLRCGGLQQTGG
jgi:hypothetical protein